VTSDCLLQNILTVSWAAGGGGGGAGLEAGHSLPIQCQYWEQVEPPAFRHGAQREILACVVRLVCVFASSRLSDWCECVLTRSLVRLFVTAMCLSGWNFQEQYPVRICRQFISCSCVFRRLSSFRFIHSSVICQTTGPQPLPKRFLHLMRSRASSFK
jgi:hypothetical protein